MNSRQRRFAPIFEMTPREIQMKTTTQPATSGDVFRRWAAVLFVLAAGALYALGVTNAHAAPAAGTVIGNQATASYTDAGGASRSATSNLVSTTVSQVKTFALTADGARTAAPGQTVYYPHTITNNGNGTDSYALVAPTTGGAFAHTVLAYYPDANGDGVPDGGPAISATGPVTAGAQFRFVVGGTVPAGAAIASTGTIVISASDTSGNPAQSNTDTTTIAASVITVTKSLSSNSGPSPSGPITVTLTYQNTGNAVANSVQLTDTLPSGMTYVPASGRWSVSGVTALTDASDGVEATGINYFSPSASNVVTAIIPAVAAGVSGNVTFQVMIDDLLTPRTIINTAQFQTSTQTSSSTNNASYQVLQTGSVVANGSNANSANGTAEPVTVAAAGAGSTVSFTNYIWNRGNGTDTFDVTIPANTFPAGTTVTLLKEDGVSSLINSSGSADPDTGPIPGKGQPCAAPLVSDGTYCGYRIVVRVSLPANASGGPYSLTVHAISAFNTAQSDDVIDTLTLVSGNSVDVTNNTARSDSAPIGTATAGNSATTGFGASGTTVITTNTVSPSISGNTVTRYQLFVNNTGFVNDNFNLSATLAASSNASVVPPALPAGWTVVFRSDLGAGNCSNVGGTITTTGTINAGANRLVCAEVTIPSTVSGTAYPGNFDFDFAATSQTNAGVTDAKRDRLTVSVVRAITITPNNTQQTFAGGVVLYNHTITNSGNAPDVANFAASCLTNSQVGWNATAYIDAAPFNSALDLATDVLITCGSTTQNLGVNQSIAIFVRVQAPGAATSSDPANVTTITATYSGTTSATDTTSVTDGLTLVKEQATVACASPGPHTGLYTQAAIAAGAATAPGQCIAYRITATNTAASTITSVVISDQVPSNTRTHFACSGNSSATPTVTVGSMAGTSAADNTGGTGVRVIANVGSLTSTQAATLYFCVRIDP
jgi:uncharacterized repeat protein (TIGR01451 family)